MAGTVNWRCQLRLIWSLLGKVCHVHCCPLEQFIVKMSLSYVKKTDEPSGVGDIFGPLLISFGSLAAENWNKKLFHISKIYSNQKNPQNILTFRFYSQWQIKFVLDNFDEFITCKINRMEEIIILSKGTLDMIFLQILQLNNWISANILCK